MLLPSRLAEYVRMQIRDSYAVKSYAQEGEDMILRELLPNPQGCYVDVGACHPKRFSNTYHFYRRGWSGVNIDATPGSMALFQRLRPRDTNIEAAIAPQQTSLTFFAFNDPALNTFDAALAAQRNTGTYRIVAEHTLATRTLAAVLAETPAAHDPIDFLSVDAEGSDLAVLQSNDWQRFRPRYVLAEAASVTLSQLAAHPTVVYLAQQGYRWLARTPRTMFFQCEHQQ